MWRLLVSCAVLGGCGFQSRAIGDDGAPPPPPPPDGEIVDAAVDAVVPDTAVIDTPLPAPSDCFAHWVSGDLMISPPVELTALSLGRERDPWISADGLRLYFEFDPNGLEESDIVLATRTTTSAAFAGASPVMELNTSSRDGRPALTPDETIVVLSSNRPGGGGFGIFLYTRTKIGEMFRPAAPDPTEAINRTPGNHFDPFLSSDGKRLYLAPTEPDHQHIVVASRASSTAPFTAPIALDGITSTDDPDADPAVSQDERILVFSSQREGVSGGGDGDLWYATRQDPRDDFGAPRPIPVVNSSRRDGDPVLSSDGCEIYFASDRRSDFHLYSARVAR